MKNRVPELSVPVHVQHGSLAISVCQLGWLYRVFSQLLVLHPESIDGSTKMASDWEVIVTEFDVPL